MTTHNQAIREEIKTHEPSATRYVVVWIALLICTFLTWYVAKIDLGSFQLAAAMLIAVLKASLVVLIFMHLWEAEGANRIVFLLSIGFLLLMMGTIIADVTHRFPLANSLRETTVNLPQGNPVYEPVPAHLAPGTAPHGPGGSGGTGE